MTPTISRILHPTDFDSGSHRALSLAALLARNLGAELHVLHVDPPGPAETPASSAPVPPPGRRPGCTDLGGVFEPLVPVLPLVASSRRAPGAARAVLDYAAERDIDLIVMGAKRLHTGFGHLLGSVAREVVDGSSCPVLTTRHGDLVATPEALARVLVPFDFSPAARRALEVAADLVRQSGGELILLHVLEPAAHGAAVRWAFSNARLRKDARARLEEAAMTLAQGVKWSLEVRSGSPVDEIVRCAAELAVDLVVVMSHASEARRTRSGSVAEEVQRFAEAPVMVVKSPLVERRRLAR